jgi:hypothetical protein
MDMRARYSLKGWSTKEYLDFFISVGSVWAAFLITLGFTLVVAYKHIHIPQEALSIPIGFGIFALAYVWDGLAHKSIYKDKIDSNELVIHNFMISSGFLLFISFIVAYWLPGLMFPFIMAFLFIKTMYSLIDEIKFHWVRFEANRSDLVEMSAHGAQFVGNILYDIGFLYLIYWNHYEVIKALFR